jgi:inhibitor of cysteine peptidase
MRRSLVPLLLVTVLLVACGKDNDDSVVSIHQQSGETISVGVGQHFAVQLPANPTTGFSWQLTADPGGQVQVLGHTYVAATPQQIGSGGNELFTFQAVSAGTTTLAFGYSRPWETGVAPAQTATFPVKVS